MACQCGSEKNLGALDFININNIGALCVVFGAEGALCRLLDLLPDFVERIMSRDFNSNTTLNVFEKMLKKVAARSIGLIINEITGQIDVSQFCQNPPPQLPEDINYYDVYQFLGGVVPILNYFFEANDILIGDSTKLIEKVVSFWLYQKWFENCKCKDCPPNTPPPPPLPYSPNKFGKCPPGQTRNIATNIYEVLIYRNNELYHQNYAVAYDVEFGRRTRFSDSFPLRNALFILVDLRFGFYLYTQDEKGVEVWTGDDFIEGELNIGWTGYNKVNGLRVPKGTLPSYVIPPCIPIPPPPIPPEFCSVYPNDPLCVVYGCTDSDALNYNFNASIDDGSCLYNCQHEDIVVVEFSDCGEERISKTVKLITNGEFEDIVVVEFSDCGEERSLKALRLFNCSSEISGCTDETASNYNSMATIDDGSCIYEISGCTDETASNYNSMATIDDDSCIYDILGCTDATAINFDPLATANDGSCIYEISGCTDETASNYNSMATIDDGSCIYGA